MSLLKISVRTIWFLELLTVYELVSESDEHVTFLITYTHVYEKFITYKAS